MRINFRGEDDLEQALREIHRRASAYVGPLVHEYMELARLSSPVEPDEPIREVHQGEEAGGNQLPPRRRETRERFEEALSLLMVLAFPVNSGTEQVVRNELNELLTPEQRVESLHTRVGNRKTSLRSNLGRRPTRRQIELRTALLEFVPRRTATDL